MSKKPFFLLLLIIVLIIAYNLIAQIVATLRSGERLQTTASQLQDLEAKNKELKKKLADVKSSDFIEQQARDKLGLGKAGETIVVIPDQKINSVLGISQESKQEVRLPNWQGWLKLFFP